MKLEEAFEKYPDTQLMTRTSWDPNWTVPSMMSRSISWLKGMSGYGNNYDEATKLGFIVPKHYVEYCNADDWEPVNDA